MKNLAPILISIVKEQRCFLGIPIKECKDASESSNQAKPWFVVGPLRN
jgi:hypothetical protein